MSDDYRDRVRSHILDGDSFVRAVFSGRQRGASVEWLKVVVRPVVLKQTRHLQFSYFDGARDISKNYSGPDAEAELDKVLGLPFKNVYVQTTQGTLEAHITKKGKALVHETRSAEQQPGPSLSHDREKKKLLSPEDRAPFLEAVGIATRDGKIKADMQRKFRQINEFLRLVAETGVFEQLGSEPVQVIDFGCGNAYLTFALYHYLNNMLGLTAYMIGVDVKGELLERHREKAEALGWTRLTFHQAQIADFQPEVLPDVVVALHACDTATDDALAQAIRAESKLIVAAPCCQHELQAQMCELPTPAAFHAVAHYGILNERLGDLLTDALRASILRIAGYRTEVIQFISTEHTAKNLMIRAVKAFAPGDPTNVREYQALKAFWGVTPYLERLLEDRFSEWLATSPGE